MVLALILLADGTEEIEFVTPYDALVRAGFEVYSVGVDLKAQRRNGNNVGEFAICSRNVSIIPDNPSLADVDKPWLKSSWPNNAGQGGDDTNAVIDIIIIPGGGPGAMTMRKSEKVLELVREVRKGGGWTGAICAGTMVVVDSVGAASATGEEGRKVRVTSHPSVKAEVEAAGWEYAAETERVVIDGKVITSRGPGTAMLFALTIVETLVGKAKRAEVQAPMMCAEKL